MLVSVFVLELRSNLTRKNLMHCPSERNPQRMPTMRLLRPNNHPVGTMGRYARGRSYHGGGGGSGRVVFYKFLALDFEQVWLAIESEQRLACVRVQIECMVVLMLE